MAAASHLSISASTLVSMPRLPEIEAGLPLHLLAEFAATSGVGLRQLYDVVIPLRTLKHRRARQENLSPDESDKLARVMRIHHQAVEVFGSMEKALRWLTRPKARFAERTPLDMLRTDAGGRLVEEMLGQIDEGMFV